MNNYHLKNRTYQFILLQNKAYHDNNKTNTKPLVRSRPQSANQVRKSNSSLSKILRSSKNYDLSLTQNNSRNTPLSSSNQNFVSNSNQYTEGGESDKNVLNQNQLYQNIQIQRPSSASTDYFYRKYRSLSSYNSTINKENNRISANTTLQVQPISFSSTPLNNTQMKMTPNSLLSNTNNGFFSSKSKSSQKPSNKSLNSVRRKLEQKRIEESNLILLKSLSQIKPQIKSKRVLDKEFEQTQKYKSNLRNFTNYGQQKPKIVIMNKEYLSPILHNYIDKKNIDNSQQSPKVPQPPKRLFRRAQNHYNNGFVCDEIDDTVNIKNYLTSNTQMQQIPAYYQEYGYQDNTINQNQKLQEELEYRRAVYDSHYSQQQQYGQQHSNNISQNEQDFYIQQLYLQQEQNQNYDNNNVYNPDSQQSPQFNQQLQDDYQENSDQIPNQDDSEYNQQEEDNYDEYTYQRQQQQNEYESEDKYYNYDDENAQNVQNNQNVMMVRDLVNNADSDKLYSDSNINQASKDDNNQNYGQYKQSYDDDDEDGNDNDYDQDQDQYKNNDNNKKYYQNQRAAQINKNNFQDDDNYKEDNDENQMYYDAQEELDEEFEQHENSNNNNKKFSQGFKENQKNLQKPNQISAQNDDTQYDEEFEEVYEEEDVDLDEMQNQYQNNNNNINQQAKIKSNQMNLQLDRQHNYANNGNYQEEEIIEEVDDEESYTKSNKVFSIRNSKGYIKNSNSQTSQNEFSEQQLYKSNQQSMFNTPSFIQD
ncbi:hypothetical protein TTHERM_00123710 (macronuclear) [Tetrahymena thermophila SB210]|uniref:Uncharacterized protein n=1 Tax=Tetrahymena thermophila (strain SB210) TaxID=312017 RepID=Q22YQ0_TETTS|nr:hypothetical protein TTHERM_00123710 [Tetrahymena thermophila SB210]EAR90621.1 hypothetical protein TTHERM_00123710 [Tetrahymena thermophila SB210]|eukprot:XP_001010866.1 hypothetical protein TTHERM_00123710 [Tetrahymena thermophila SB210]